MFNHKFMSELNGLRIKVILTFQSKRKKKQAFSNRKDSGTDGGFIQLYTYLATYRLIHCPTTSVNLSKLSADE